MRKVPVEQRLREGSVDGPNGCRLWVKYINWGYGIIRIGGASRRAHRIAYELANGPIPPRMYVCHRCDVRNCINPEHLFLGTSAENYADMVAKNRQAKGARRGNAKLTDDIVRAMRREHAAGLSFETIGKKYGVSAFGTAYRAIRGRTWRHVTDQEEHRHG